MNLRLLSLVNSDIRHSIEWYEKEKKGLGKRFYLSLLETFARLMQSLFQFPVLFDEFRIARLAKPFPFSVVYRVFQNEIIVIAVAHDKRDPNFWKERT